MVDVIGITLLVIGTALLGIEFAHPGVLLAIPGSVLLVAGFLALIWGDGIIENPIGVGLMVAAAVASAFGEVRYYQWLAPSRAPEATTMATLVGREGTVVGRVVPNTLRGKVRIGSEVWSAQGSIPLPPGTRVRVVKAEGVSVTVEAVDRGVSPGA